MSERFQFYPGHPSGSLTSPMPPESVSFEWVHGVNMALYLMRDVLAQRKAPVWMLQEINGMLERFERDLEALKP